MPTSPRFVPLVLVVSFQNHCCFHTLLRALLPRLIFPKLKGGMWALCASLSLSGHLDFEMHIYGKAYTRVWTPQHICYSEIGHCVEDMNVIQSLLLPLFHNKTMVSA
jgi:hypothetical protein